MHGVLIRMKALINIDSIVFYSVVIRQICDIRLLFFFC